MKRLDWVIYATMLVVILSLAFRVQQLGAYHSSDLGQSSDPADSGEPLRDLLWRRILEDSTLPYLSNDVMWESAEMKDSFHLLVFFLKSDCYSCSQEVEFWNELAQRFSGRLRVVGVTTGDSLAEMRYFVAKQGIAIPVVFDSKGTIFDQLGILDNGRTPLKILVNRKGTVLHISATTYRNALIQHQYIDTIEAIVP